MNDLYIITGAAGGMGIAAAKRFKDYGDLLLLDLSESGLENLKNELGENVYTMKFDIANDDDIAKVVEFVKPYGSFKALIHYAGISNNMGNSRKIIEINEKGTVNLVNALYDYAKEGSVVINTASMAGHSVPATPEVSAIIDETLETKEYDKLIECCGDNVMMAYGYSKRAVIRFTKNVAPMFGRKGARVVCISPGTILTPMLQHEVDNGNDGVIDNIIKVTPIGRIGKAEDIADLTEYLCSDKAAFLTGIDILCDGGSTYNVMKLRGMGPEV